MSKLFENAARQIASIGKSEREPLIASSLVCLILAICPVLFWKEVQGAVRVWIDSRTFNHCFLVLPLCVFLIWHRRTKLRGLYPRPDIRAAIAIFGLSLLWLMASAVGVLEAQQFIVMTMVQAALFGSMGAVLYRRLLAPLLYLYFLVPTGTFLVPQLQLFTAHFTVAGLHLLGIPVFSNGAVIEIPVGTFAVAEACAGLRFLIAAIAFGVFYALLTYRSYVRRCVFIAMSIVVPVLANGLRALGLVAAAEWIGSPAAALADHIIYGWLFFSFVLFLLILVGRTFSDLDDEQPRLAAPPQPRNRSIANDRRSVLVALVCIVAAAPGPLMAGYIGVSQEVDLPRVAPTVPQPWHQTANARDWQPVVVGPARTFADSFDNGTTRIDRFIALFSAHGHGSRIMRSENRAADENEWSFDSQSDEEWPSTGGAVPVHVTTWLRGAQQRVVWSFYVVNGVPVASVWAAKRQELYAYLAKSQCVSAYVALSMETPTGPVSNLVVRRFLAVSQPLKAYFCPQSKGLR